MSELIRQGTTQPPAQQQLRELITSDNRMVALSTIVALCLLVGLIGGATMGLLGPILTVALMVAIVAGLLVLRSTQWGLAALIGLICLLPYGALPVNIGFTPTFLDLAMLAVFLVWAANLVSGRQRQFIASSLGLPILVFLLWCTFTFVAGLAHAPLTANVLRHFVEVLLAISFFYVAINCVKTQQQLEGVTLAILLAGSAAAAIGVVLYFIPGEWTIRLLSVLRPFGYPTGGDVLRYIEDDPSQALRATSTSIDPNALGGLLVLVSALPVAQLFSPKPLLRRPFTALMFVVVALALILTFSRGAMAGMVAALAFLAVVRYRRLLPLMLLGGVLFLTLPQAQGYAQRFIEGIQGQDLATQMRFGEYKDALILISRYPLLGVGFAGAPDIDLYIGVSSLYLIIAEQVGLVGLGIFLAVMAGFFAITLSAWLRARPEPRLEGILLGYVAALAGVLVSSSFDHFFFNIDFIHLVCFMWLNLGLGVAAARLASTQYLSEKSVA
jgi:O-antigen ligase